MDAVETRVQFELGSRTMYMHWSVIPCLKLVLGNQNFISVLPIHHPCVCVSVWRGGGIWGRQLHNPSSCTTIFSLSLTTRPNLMWSIVRQFVVLVFPQPSVHDHLFPSGVVEGEPKVSSQRDQGTQWEGNVKPYGSPSLSFPMRYVRWKNTVVLIVVQCSYNHYHRKCVYKPLIWGRVVQTSDFLPYKAACTAHRKENVP